MKNRRKVGEHWEKRGRAYLEERGLQFLEKNFYSNHSEIDLVFFDPAQKHLVFVEVRARNSAFSVSLAMSLQTKVKQRALRRGARAFLGKVFRCEIRVPKFEGIRFDVLLFENGNWNYFPAAFSV